jgi:hypothetical protein
MLSPRVLRIAAAPLSHPCLPMDPILSIFTRPWEISLLKESDTALNLHTYVASRPELALYNRNDCRHCFAAKSKGGRGRLCHSRKYAGNHSTTSKNGEATDATALPSATFEKSMVPCQRRSACRQHSKGGRSKPHIYRARRLDAWAT